MPLSLTCVVEFITQSVFQFFGSPARPPSIATSSPSPADQKENAVEPLDLLNLLLVVLRQAGQGEGGDGGDEEGDT